MFDFYRWRESDRRCWGPVCEGCGRLWWQAGGVRKYRFDGEQYLFCALCARYWAFRLIYYLLQGHALGRHENDD